jgi:hypothetical protein
VGVKVIKGLIDLMRSGQKFLMPNCAEVIDPQTLGDTHLELFKLPYPVTIFEASWDKGEAAELIGDQQQSTRRIAVCWDTSSGVSLVPGREAFLNSFFPEGGTYIMPVSYIDARKMWVPAAAGLFVPYNYLTKEGDELSPAGHLAKQIQTDSGRLKKGARNFVAEPFVVSPMLYGAMVQHFGGEDMARAHNILEGWDEVQMAVQACAVLNCANVVTAEIKPKSSQQSVRAAKRKEPFFTYKVLQIDTRDSEQATRGAGGAHASPRTHLRRGHIRRYADKVTWVRASMINAGSRDGTVSKDYRIS